MFQYPTINPIAFKIGSLPVHWYGLMYLLGFALAWLLALYRAKDPRRHFNSTEVGDLIFYSAIGLIIGARAGEMLFYNFSTLIHDPLELFKIWHGGMSFHGGLLGVILATWIYSRQFKKNWFDVVDFLVPLVPLGLACGRIGNFINGELWGRITHVPWAMIFPNTDGFPRHPSQLYEFFFEGIILFLITWIYSIKIRPRFAVSSVFLLGYGVFRFVLEFFRNPDAIIWGWLTEGQLLSIPMILIGLIGLWHTHQCGNKNGALSKS